MSKLKLNIQRFSATNHTAHYNLSQYISTDKPTYLVDYNSDMLAIDTAIYNPWYFILTHFKKEDLIKEYNRLLY